MKLIEKDIFSFKAQSDKLIGWNVFKCNLFDEAFNRYDLFFTISNVHLNLLFGTTEDDLMIGEYGKLRDYNPGEKYNDDEVKLTMVFNLDGIFFEAHYVINIVNGEVTFAMDRPSIMREDFVALEDMDAELVELINDKMKADKHLALIDDARFDAYFSEKFLNTFIDYIGYLEELVAVDKCKDCAYKRTYRLSGFCKELYVKNRCIPEE